MPAPPRLQKGSEATSSRAADLHLNSFSFAMGGNRQPIFHQGFDLGFDAFLDVRHRLFLVRPLRNTTL